MSSIVSRSPPFFGSVSSLKERRWISIRWGTSRGFCSREKLLRVTGAAFERAKVGDSSGGQRDGYTARVKAQVDGSQGHRRATTENNTRGTPAPWCPHLLELYGGAGLFQLGLQLVGLLALDALLDRFRSLVDHG